MEGGSEDSRKRLRETPPSHDKQDTLMPIIPDFLTQSIDFSSFMEDDSDKKVSQIIKCKCKQSKCLKLYCDCFANSLVCGMECQCQNCNNTENNSKEIEKARRAIVRRNPSGFEKKISNGTMHTRGCKCKSSKCIKKYCECFQSGVQCTQNCQCNECANGKNGFFSESSTKSTFEESLLSYL